LAIPTASSLIRYLYLSRRNRPSIPEPAGLKRAEEPLILRCQRPRRHRRLVNRQIRDGSTFSVFHSDSVSHCLADQSPISDIFVTNMSSVADGLMRAHMLILSRSVSFSRRINFTYPPSKYAKILSIDCRRTHPRTNGAEQRTAQLQKRSRYNTQPLPTPIDCMQDLEFLAHAFFSAPIDRPPTTHSVVADLLHRLSLPKQLCPQLRSPKNAKTLVRKAGDQ